MLTGSMEADSTLRRMQHVATRGSRSRILHEQCSVPLMYVVHDRLDGAVNAKRGIRASPPP